MRGVCERGKRQECSDTDVICSFFFLKVSSLLQTEVITFSSALSGETERLVAQEMPVIHTEMKTITYEALQV